jgi:transmembrane sensor
LNNSFENIDDLLGKHFAGEASEPELVQVKLWLEQSVENRRYYNQLKSIFDNAAKVKEWQEFDTDAAWNKMRANLRTASTPVIPLQERPLDLSWVWKIAASFLLVCVAVLYFYKYMGSESTQPLEIIAEKKALSDTLPDGSNVFLNKSTKMTYAFDAATNTHEVKLKGEAYFNVKHSKREEFIIDADGVYIKDIGTSFNVKAYPDRDIVEVLVEEGEIVFFTESNPGIHLKESGKGVYNRKTKTFTIEPPDQNITAYKTKFFIFTNSTLGDVADALNNVYDTKVIVPDHLEGCTLTVSFRDENIEVISAVIAETLGLTLTTAPGTITFEGSGCE